MGLLVRNAALLAVVCIASTAAWNALIRTSKIDPGHVHLLPPPPMEGIYAHNEKLSMAEPLGWGMIPNPEDLALDKDKKSFFTGCGDGWIKRVWIDRPGGEHVENWTFVGGRPLGVALGPNEELIVCEVEKGLLNVTKNKVEVLCSEADGSKFKMVDGVDITKEGVIYFTDATNKFTPEELELELLEYRPHGRLIKYDPTSKTPTVLLTDLYFPNGVALSSKEDFLVFCETFLFRCMKYWLKGEKSGKVETFIENLPGFPDNVGLDSEGTFWIGLIGRRNVMWDLIAKYPSLRHVLVRLWSKINAYLFNTAGILGVKENGDVIAFFSDSKRTFITGGIKVDSNLYFSNVVGTSFYHLELS